MANFPGDLSAEIVRAAGSERLEELADRVSGPLAHAILGQDPEVRYTANGGAVANISVATNESWRDKATGEAQERTEWHRIVMFGKLAEIAQQYLKGGHDGGKPWGARLRYRRGQPRRDYPDRQ